MMTTNQRIDESPLMREYHEVRGLLYLLVWNIAMVTCLMSYMVDSTTAVTINRFIPHRLTSGFGDTHELRRMLGSPVNGKPQWSHRDRAPERD
jgi:hypothetical protein